MPLTALKSISSLPYQQNFYGTLRRVLREPTRRFHVDNGACAVIVYAFGKFNGVIMLRRRR